MSIGGGKYDYECTQILINHGAEVAIVIVFGEGQNGFSMAATPYGMTTDVPKVLRALAGQIEQDISRMQERGN